MKKLGREYHKVLSDGGCRSAVETELGSDAAKGVDAEGDMILKGDAEFFGAFVNVIAIDAASEGLVLQFFLYTGGFHFMNAFAGFDESAGGQESGQFVAGEKGAIELRFAWNATVIGVT
jgi:hypothetical protein